MHQDSLGLPAPHGHIRLHAYHLFSKCGFDDGAIITPILVESPYRDVSDADVLVLTVERHLLPNLPRPIKTYRIVSHNPIRADHAETMDAAIESAFVDIPVYEILKIAAEVEATPDVDFFDRKA